MLDFFHRLPIEAVKPELAARRLGPRQYLPGLLATALATHSAAYLSQRHGPPLIAGSTYLLALLVIHLLVPRMEEARLEGE